MGRSAFKGRHKNKCGFWLLQRGDEFVVGDATVHQHGGNLVGRCMHAILAICMGRLFGEQGLVQRDNILRHNPAVRHPSVGVIADDGAISVPAGCDMSQTQ